MLFDQLEQWLFRPVDVLEDEHERLGLSHELCPLAGGPGDLLLAALAVDRLEHAGRQAEQIGDRLRRGSTREASRSRPRAGRRRRYRQRS